MNTLAPASEPPPAAHQPGPPDDGLSRDEPSVSGCRNGRDCPPRRPPVASGGGVGGSRPMGRHLECALTRPGQPSGGLLVVRKLKARGIIIGLDLRLVGESL